MKYLIIGNKGQLGSEFERELLKLNAKYKAVDIDQLNISDYLQVKNIYETEQPDIVLNCSAYNFVDKAESEKEAAFWTNSIGVRNLALEADKNKCMLVHYSSDYVFDGTKKDGFYSETDLTNPINVYGQSKLQGEKEIQEILDRYLIFRLSWVFGKGKQNFIYKFLEWTKSTNQLKISNDEVSVPTSTKDVVKVTLKALENGLSGLYHSNNSGYCSRFEWAEFIIQKKILNVTLEPVSKEIFNLPAKRPEFSVMSNSKIKSIAGIEIPDWQEAVEKHLNH